LVCYSLNPSHDFME